MARLVKTAAHVDELPDDAVERECPFCSATVFTSDSTLSVHHSAPACEQWTSVVELLGGERTMPGWRGYEVT